jgi:alginate O-acetyltransferase complex protein AlgJ
MAAENKTVEIRGDLWQALVGRKPPPEKLTLRFVTDKATKQAVAPDRGSAIVLMGDSHNLVFHAGGDMYAAGAGLPDQLAMELGGVAVDLVAVRGSGATPARINLMRLARADGNYLAGKKVVIWCFSAREFTESAGWQKVPVVK